MEPYVIRQGDFVLKLAYKFGFDADAVWNDDANADLRQIRADPNILFPGDVLYIPDREDPEPVSLTTGGSNQFISDVPTMTLTHQFVGDDETTYASKAYTVEELDDLTGLQTDETGLATFSAPVTLQRATITFTDSGDSFELAIGQMYPLNTAMGVFQRLQNLGYLDEDEAFDLDAVRFGLVALQADQSRDDSSSDTPPDDDPDDAKTQVPDLVDDDAFDEKTVRRLLLALRKVYGC